MLLSAKCLRAERWLGIDVTGPSTTLCFVTLPGVVSKGVVLRSRSTTSNNTQGFPCCCLVGFSTQPLPVGDTPAVLAAFIRDGQERGHRCWGLVPQSFYP